MVGALIGIVLGGCFLIGLRARDPRQPLEIAWVGAIGAITVCVAVVGAIVSGSGASGRYFAVAVPLIVLAAAAGVVRLPPVVTSWSRAARDGRPVGRWPGGRGVADDG